MSLEQSDYLTYKITVLGPLAIDAKVLPNSCNNSPYPVEIFTASGGLAPYVWDHSTSVLPTGVSFNDSTQQLSGTPTVSGVSYNLHLQVTDANLNTATGDFPFIIYAPPTITTTTVSDGVFSASYTDAVVASAGSAAITTYVIVSGSLPAGLTLNIATGAITGTITSPFGFFPFTVRVSDANGCHADRSLSINVTNTPLAITTNSLPGSCRDTSYSQFLVAANGAVPYTWSIVSGTLPDFLSLDSSTGEISGTVDAAATVQTYTVTFRVTDNAANTADKPLGIEVFQEPVWVTTSPLPNGNVGVPYSHFVNASNTFTYSFQAGTPPPGLNIEVGTGEIDGTPTLEGVYSFTVRATSINGCIADRVFQITIGAAPPTIVGLFTNVCKNISYYNNSIVVTGGTAPFQFMITGGALPINLVLGTDTGDVSGVTAQSGVFNFDITVKDSTGASSTTTFGFTVYDSPVITQPIIPPGIYGRPYSYTFASTGGTDPKTWILYGTLPSGILFSSLYGTLSGTPLEFGYFDLTIGIQDANGCVDTKKIALIIGGPPVIVTASLPPACQNQEYGVNPPVNIIVEGGVPPYYWFIVSDNFPPQDLVLNPYTGQLSGIPLVPGSYSFTVKVVDSNNLFAEQDYTLVVRTEKECGQPDEGETVTVTKTRLTSLESDPVVVVDPFHQKHLFEYLPAPFLIKNE